MRLLVSLLVLLFMCSAAFAFTVATGPVTDIIGRNADKAKVEIETGTGAYDLVQLDATAKLPAVDGSNLTGISIAADSVGESELIEAMNFSATGEWNFSAGGIEVENGTTPPACTEGQLFFDTDATTGQRLLGCEGTAFQVQGDGNSGSPATADITDVNVTQTELAELETIGATTIALEQWGALGSMATTLTGTELSLLDGITVLSGSNTGDNTIATSGDSATAFFSSGELEDAYIVNTITASNYLPLAGGTLTGELVADELGIEGQETDTITDCSGYSTTGGGIFYDDSEGVWKKCQDNVLTVLDTDTGGAPEGTAVLSTGEGSATKYLREDGDGTSSWQVPSGSGDMLLGTVQTVTANKTFNDGTLIVAGLTSGTSVIKADAVAGTTTFTLPATSGTLVAGASANGLSLISAANYAAMKVLLDLEIGYDVQEYSTNLVEFAATNPTANAKTLLEAADYAAMRTLFGMGDAYALNGSNVNGGIAVYQNGTCDATHTQYQNQTTCEAGAGTWTAYSGVLLPIGEVIDATGFDGNLATTDDTLVEVAQAFDDLDVAGVTTKTTAAAYTIGTTDWREAYEGVIYVTAAATITIPAVALRNNFAVITVGAVAVSVDPNVVDKMYLDGVLLDDGDKATNTSTSGDIIVFSYFSGDGWYAVSGSNDGDLWTDGGP